MSFLVFKALHVISIVCWFAGLFYLGRLLIYVKEAQNRPENEAAILVPQLATMARRLFRGITVPAGLATLVFGVIIMGPAEVATSGWFHAKLLLVVGLIFYQFYLGRLVKAAQTGTIKLSGRVLRILNEFPTVFLVAIVTLIYFRNYWLALGTHYWIAGLIGVIGLVIYRFSPRD